MGGKDAVLGLLGEENSDSENETNLLKQQVEMLGAKAIIGNCLLKDRIVVFDFKNNKIVIFERNT